MDASPALVTARFSQRPAPLALLPRLRSHAHACRDPKVLTLLLLLLTDSLLNSKKSSSYQRRGRKGKRKENLSLDLCRQHDEDPVIVMFTIREGM